MPTLLQTPGVYIQEVTGPGVIQGVGTSTAAFIGPAVVGPIGQPTFLTTFDDYKRIFGTLPDGNLALYITSPRRFYLTDAVSGFFQNGGTQAYVYRVGTGKQATWAVTNQAATPETVFLVQAIALGSCRQRADRGDRRLQPTRPRASRWPPAARQSTPSTRRIRCSPSTTPARSPGRRHRDRRPARDGRRRQERHDHQYDHPPGPARRARRDQHARPRRHHPRRPRACGSTRRRTRPEPVRRQRRPDQWGGCYQQPGDRTTRSSRRSIAPRLADAGARAPADEDIPPRPDGPDAHLAGVHPDDHAHRREPGEILEPLAQPHPPQLRDAGGAPRPWSRSSRRHCRR